MSDPLTCSERATWCQCVEPTDHPAMSMACYSCNRHLALWCRRYKGDGFGWHGANPAEKSFVVTLLEADTHAS